MKWLWLEFSSAVLLGTGKLLLNNARFITVTITGQMWECTLALTVESASNQKRELILDGGV